MRQARITEAPELANECPGCGIHDVSSSDDTWMKCCFCGREVDLDGEAPPIAMCRFGTAIANLFSDLGHLPPRYYDAVAAFNERNIGVSQVEQWLLKNRKMYPNRDDLQLLDVALEEIGPQPQRGAKDVPEEEGHPAAPGVPQI